MAPVPVYLMALHSLKYVHTYISNTELNAIQTTYLNRNADTGLVM